MNDAVKLKITKRLQSNDGSVKYTFSNNQNLEYEAVYFQLPFQTTKDYRYTICISSQAGCALNCSFCATGEGGFFGNLSAEEMFAQVDIVRDDLIRLALHSELDNFQIAFMAMGEPLINYNNVVKFCSSAKEYYNSLNKISLSTVGIVPRMSQLASEKNVDIDLFVSVHSPYESQRDQIIPINKKYPLDLLIKTCHEYAAAKNTFVNASYLLMGGFNDSDQHAIDFCNMLDPKLFRIQILLYNEGYGSAYKRPLVSTAQKFKAIAENYNFETMVILSKGQDINAGCGQLVKMQSKRVNGVKLKPTCNRLGSILS
jgi:23S rRNA (adenine2503-C2)-methyltransferase